MFFLVLIFPGLALAHHGGQEYDLNKTVEFKGKLTSVEMINPHSWIYFRSDVFSGIDISRSGARASRRTGVRPQQDSRVQGQADQRRDDQSAFVDLLQI